MAKKNYMGYIEKEILKNQDLYPFHMPGHKRNKDFIPDDLLKLDMTEVNKLDNLHNPMGVIRAVQNKCAEIFDCTRSFIMTNGASSAVMAAVFSVCCEKDKIVAFRNSHKSFYNAVELCGARPVYYYSPEVLGIDFGLDYIRFETLLKQEPKATAVFVTSPNYEGLCLDIEQIAKIVHRCKKILIVDESHGSHFNFDKKFPKSAIKSGADLVINSLHKTLPCLTQSAVLHVNSDFIDINRVQKYVSMFQTTSPSYIIMTIIEKTIDKLSKPNSYKKYLEKLINLRKKLLEFKTIRLLSKNIIKKFKKQEISDIDITKLTFFINSNIASLKIEKILRDRFKIQIEMCGCSYFLALSSIADTDEGFDRLYNAIKTLDSELKYRDMSKTILLDNNYNNKNNKPQVIYTPREAMQLKSEYRQIDFCANKITADYIIKYPPGIPLLVPGELIDKNLLSYIKNYIKSQKKIRADIIGPKYINNEIMFPVIEDYI